MLTGARAINDAVKRFGRWSRQIVLQLELGIEARNRLVVVVLGKWCVFVTQPVVLSTVALQAVNATGAMASRVRATGLDTRIGSRRALIIKGESRRGEHIGGGEGECGNEGSEDNLHPVVVYRGCRMAVVLVARRGRRGKRGLYALYSHQVGVLFTDRKGVPQRSAALWVRVGGAEPKLQPRRSVNSPGPRLSSVESPTRPPK